MSPIRFAALAEQMADDLPANYFNAIIWGVIDSWPASNDASVSPIDLEQVVSLVQRVHELPDRPCGISIAWLIEKWGGSDWPDDVVDLVAWYAINDPDPKEEIWKTPAWGGQLHYQGDPYQAGINSTRGSIADAIARLLFDKPERFERLNAAIDSLVHDRSIAVRSCAIKVLLARSKHRCQESDILVHLSGPESRRGGWAGGPVIQPDPPSSARIRSGQWPCAGHSPAS